MIKVRQATKQGYIECIGGGIADLSYPNSLTRRGRVQENGTICPTITTQGELCKIMSEVEIYRLTPRESWRLMGFSDEDFDKANKIQNGVQKHLYKQAGNSICVKVLEAVFKEML